jgi:beta-aspartyl-peptidase (threonine type)
MAYLNAPLDRAAQASLDKAMRLGGDGGLIAIDAKGQVTMPFNTKGMFRAVHTDKIPAAVALFGK